MSLYKDKRLAPTGEIAPVKSTLTRSPAVEAREDRAAGGMGKP
jgi:hypothetical protein